MYAGNFVPLIKVSRVDNLVFHGQKNGNHDKSLFLPDNLIGLNPTSDQFNFVVQKFIFCYIL